MTRHADLRAVQGKVAALRRTAPQQPRHLDRRQRLGAVPDADLLVIKPSGVSYDDLSADSMVITDLDGTTVVDGDHMQLRHRRPRLRLQTHADVNGVVHTPPPTPPPGAPLCAEPIPCVLTMIADEFGGGIPVGPFALIGDDSIGRGIVDTLRGSRSKAVLMRNHGVFTIGHTAKEAVKVAVMCEDVARTVHIARQLGEVLPIAESDIDSLYARYQNAYGQVNE
jgi:L-ribulose-5-phosphate 4-epimerase